MNLWVALADALERRGRKKCGNGCKDIDNFSLMLLVPLLLTSKLEFFENIF